MKEGCAATRHPRKLNRKKVIMEASLLTPRGLTKVRVRDLSQHGARVTCADSLPAGVDVVLRRADVFAAAQVVWSTEREAGLQFYRAVPGLNATSRQALAESSNP
jgi:hypothetical protein